MSAELLRRAAKALRDHVSRLPWAMRQLPWPLDTTDNDDPDGVATYAKLMHPPVALAVADWLDTQATAIDDWHDFTERAVLDDPTETDEAALAVARAILRDQP